MYTLISGNSFPPRLTFFLFLTDNSFELKCFFTNVHLNNSFLDKAETGDTEMDGAKPMKSGLGIRSYGSLFSLHI